MRCRILRAHGRRRLPRERRRGDNPKLVEPEDPDDAFKIVEVLEIGYRVRTLEGHDVIQPAKVKIYGTKN